MKTIEESKKDYNDYYGNVPTYVKYIMDKLDKEDTTEGIFFKEIFNGILNSFDQEVLEIKLKEMLFVTPLLINRLLEMKKRKREIVIDTIYNHYIKPMIHCCSNGDLDAVKLLFDSMNEKTKEISGYLGIYGDNKDIACLRKARS